MENGNAYSAPYVVGPQTWVSPVPSPSPYQTSNSQKCKANEKKNISTGVCESCPLGYTLNGELTQCVQYTPPPTQPNLSTTAYSSQGLVYASPSSAYYSPSSLSTYQSPQLVYGAQICTDTQVRDLTSGKCVECAKGQKAYGNDTHCSAHPPAPLPSVNPYTPNCRPGETLSLTLTGGFCDAAKSQTSLNYAQLQYAAPVYSALPITTYNAQPTYTAPTYATYNVQPTYPTLTSATQNIYPTYPAPTQATYNIQPTYPYTTSTTTAYPTNTAYNQYNQKVWLFAEQNREEETVNQEQSP